MTSREDSTSQRAEVSYPDGTVETNTASAPSTLVKTPEQVRPFSKHPARKENARGKKRGKCMIARHTRKNHLKRNVKKIKGSRKIGLHVSDNKHVESIEGDLAMEKLLVEELQQSSEDSHED